MKSKTRKDQCLLPVKVIKALEYIKEHSDDELCLKTVASVIGLTDKAFCQLFKQHIEEGFIAYVNKLRLEKAKKSLEKEVSEIKEIAYTVGFRPNYFCRLFKRTYGISPREYRREFWNHRADIVL